MDSLRPHLLIVADAREALRLAGHVQVGREHRREQSNQIRAGEAAQRGHHHRDAARTQDLAELRDQMAMAAALGWDKVAPFYIDLEAPVPHNGIPKPGPLQVHLKDDHLQYAITWFTLAFAVAIAFAVWWRRRPRA